MIPAGFSEFLLSRQDSRRMSACQPEMSERSRPWAECPPSCRRCSTGRPRWGHCPKGPQRTAYYAKGSRTSADCPPRPPTPGECLRHRAESHHCAPLSADIRRLCRFSADNGRMCGISAETAGLCGTSPENAAPSAENVTPSSALAQQGLTSQSVKIGRFRILRLRPRPAILATWPQGPQVQKVQKPSS